MFLRAFPLLIVSLSVVSVFLNGCSQPPEPVQREVSRPVKTIVVEDPVTGGVRQFPARIDANKKAELSFRVAGSVQQLLVKEGDRVKSGQVVAKLDPKDYQILVNDRKATYDKARKNFNRAKELVDKGHISKADYDRLEAEFKNARAALEKVRQDLDYTVLKAPFAGIVAKRHIQEFEEIRPMQPIFDLQFIDRLDVKFNLPESVIRGLESSGGKRGHVRDQVKAFATFSGVPGERFPLTFKELATQADAKTQTYEVTYTMERPADATVLPGMTATVTLDMTAVLRGREQVFLLPVEAVVGDYKLDPIVWVVDERSMTVKSAPVHVRQMRGHWIEVTDGLKPGQRVVTAGAAFLQENMKVALLPEREQAQPRPSDLAL